MSSTEVAATAAPTGKQTVKIQGFDFEVPAPYAVGHVLLANEASTLNQTYGENIRNNAASKIKAAQEAAAKSDPPGEFDIDAIDGIKGTAPTETKTKTLRQLIDDYAATYVFGVRSASTKEPVDPVEREAFRMASDTINEALREKGVKRKDLPEGQYDAAVAAYAKRDDIVKEAKRRVETRSKIGKDSLNLGELGIATAPSETAAAAA